MASKAKLKASIAAQAPAPAGALRWYDVESSTIARVAYEPACSTLYVGFRSGDIYRYLMVQPGTFGRLLSAPSIGSYFSFDVRGRFTTEKLAGDTWERLP